MRGEDGKVMTGPPNFVTKKGKAGKTDRVYFSPPTYVSVEDPYKPPIETVGRISDPKAHEKAGHDKPFKPAKHVRSDIYKAPYEHMKDMTEKKPLPKDEDGNIKFAPKNFYTSSKNLILDGTRRRAETFNPYPEHIKDDYDYPKEVAKKEFLEGKKLEQEKPFSQKARKFDYFNSNKNVLGEDVPLPAKAVKPEPKPPIEHEAKWKPAKPSRRGYSCTFEKFPEHMPNPLKFTERKQKDENADDRKPFVRTKKEYTRPTPSVVTNLRNLKSSFPSVFRR